MPVSYKVILMPTIGEVEAEVSRLMQFGWLPTGGLELMRQMYAQALWLPITDGVGTKKRGRKTAV